MTDALTSSQAYAAMFAFLDEIYERTQLDGLGSLLGSMTILEDGRTADPALWKDWEEAIRKVKEQGNPGR